MPRRCPISLAAPLLVAALAVGGCGQASPSAIPASGAPATSQGSASPADKATTATAPLTRRAHPQTIEPVAGVVPRSTPSSTTPATVGVDSGSGTLAQPASDAQIRRELAASGLSASPSQATLTPSGLAIAPIGAPPEVQAVINAGNEIAHLPYRFGGGHGTFEDSAYDCSGSLSFVFAASGLLRTTMTSGELMSWGAPGPGKWITVFADAGHTFMYVAGLRFDTVALAEYGSRWSNRAADDGGGFVARHPIGL